MFDTKQKEVIAEVVQTLLRSTNDPELPSGEIQFLLHVDGELGSSWANIRNNGAKRKDLGVRLEVLKNNLWLK